VYNVTMIAMRGGYVSMIRLSEDLPGLSKARGATSTINVFIACPTSTSINVFIVHLTSTCTITFCHHSKAFHSLISEDSNEIPGESIKYVSRHSLL